MSKEYVYFRPNGTPSASVALDDVMVSSRRRIHSGDGPMWVTQNDHVVTDRDLDRARVLKRYHGILEHGSVGDVWKIENKDGALFKARQVVEAINIINTNGNDHSDEFWSWVVATYPQYHPRFAGSYVCKDIAGSSTPSQHSYGNAVDIFFDSMTHQVDVFKAVERGDAPVAVAHAISGSRIWEPGSGEQSYGGDYHSHLHTDYIPQYSGSCGVRG